MTAISFPQDLGSQLYSKARALCVSENGMETFECELGCQLAGALLSQAGDLLVSNESAQDALCLLDGAFELTGEMKANQVQRKQCSELNKKDIPSLLEDLEGKVLASLFTDMIL